MHILYVIYVYMQYFSLGFLSCISLSFKLLAETLSLSILTFFLQIKTFPWFFISSENQAHEYKKYGSACRITSYTLENAGGFRVAFIFTESFAAKHQRLCVSICLRAAAKINCALIIRRAINTIEPHGPPSPAPARRQMK